MTGHNLNESSIFVPNIITNSNVEDYIEEVLYSSSAAARDYVLTELYPDILDGTYNYTTEFSRTALLISELAFSCITRYLGTAFDNRTYNYRFQVPPGTHGQNMEWTFWSGTSTSPDVDPELAKAIQRYYTSFAMTGNPNSGASSVLPEWPVYGEEAVLITFGEDGIGTIIDDTKNPRCEYWQTAKYLDHL